MNTYIHLCNATGVPSVGKVQTKIHELEEKFKALRKSTRVCLELHGIDVKVVVECLTDLPADDMPEHQLFLKEHIDELLKAENLLELFLRMNLYWSYLSYHLLEHIIKELSVEEVKGKMEEYQRDLGQFIWDTPVEVFCQTQKKREVDLPAGFRKMVAKFTWPEAQKVTLGVVEEFRQQYACHYNLRECAMMLITVRSGSFIVVWFIPESIVMRLIKDVEKDILLKYGVTRLEIAETCVFEQVIVFYSSN